MLIASWVITFVLIIGVGIYAGTKITSSNQWSGGDKTLSAWGVGAVLAAWQIGGISIVGAAQGGYVNGISGMWYSLINGVYLLFVGVLAKALRENMPGDSVPVYLNKRYSRTNSRVYSYIWLCLGIVYVPIQLRTIASIIQIVLPQFNANAAMVIGLAIAAVYTGFSGMKGAADIGKIVCIATYVLLIGFMVNSLNEIGGYDTMVAALPEGHGDWMNGMRTQTLIAWLVGGILSSAVMQTVLQPVMAAKSPNAARVGSFIGYLFAAPISIVTAIIGMMGRYRTDALDHGATAFAWAIRDMSTPLIGGIIFAVVTMIIAATMSSMMMANGTVLKNIYVDQINPKATDKQILNVARYGTIVFALSSLIIVFFIPAAAITSVFLTIIHIATGPISFSILAGILWKRTTRQASLWSMIAGAVVGVAWWAAGMNTFLEPIYAVIVATYGTGIVITMMTSKPGDDNSNMKAIQEELNGAAA